MRNIFLAFLLYAMVIMAKGQSVDYADYHKEVIRCEELISENKISQAREVLKTLFSEFDFVFLREYQVATELSVYDGDHDSAFELLRSGILHGWTIKQMKKSKNLRPLRKDARWDRLAADYDSLRDIYMSQLNLPLRKEAHKMLKKDQKIALRAFLKISEKKRIKFALKKFKPYSEGVLIRLNKMLNEYGYPGEKLIGNSWWTSVNLSHHNSFDREYTLNDTLYLNLRPQLYRALERGQLHPKEFAIIEDWRNAAIHQHQSSLFGFLGKIPDESTLMAVNQNREKLGLRSIELRNKLLDIEEETGLNLYIPKGWQKGKITVANK